MRRITKLRQTQRPTLKRRLKVTDRQRSTSLAVIHTYNLDYDPFQKSRVRYFQSCGIMYDKVKGSNLIAGKARPVSILKDADLIASIPLEDCRNFCFIAHVDHGKSSLASRVLEITGNLGPEQQWTAIERAGILDEFAYPNKNIQNDSGENAAKEQIELLVRAKCIAVFKISSYGTSNVQ